MNNNRGLSNIDNELYEICKDIDISYNQEDNNIKDGHITSDNVIMTGSIFSHGRYEDTETYKNVNSNAFNELLSLSKK